MGGDLRVAGHRIGQWRDRTLRPGALGARYIINTQHARTGKYSVTASKYLSLDLLKPI